MYASLSFDLNAHIAQKITLISCTLNYNLNNIDAMIKNKKR